MEKKNKGTELELIIVPHGKQTLIAVPLVVEYKYLKEKLDALYRNIIRKITSLKGYTPNYGRESYSI